MVWVLGYFLKKIPNLGDDVWIDKVGANYIVVSQRSDTIKLLLIDTLGNIVNSKFFVDTSIYNIRTVKTKGDSIYIAYDGGVVLTTSAFSTIIGHLSDTLPVRITDINPRAGAISPNIASIVNMGGNDYFFDCALPCYSSIIITNMKSQNSKIIYPYGSPNGIRISVFDTTLYIQKGVGGPYTLRISTYDSLIFLDTASLNMFLLATSQDFDSIFIIRFDTIFGSPDTFHIKILSLGALGIRPYGMRIYNGKMAIYGEIVDGGTYGFMLIMDTSGIITAFSRFNINNTITKFFDLHNYIGMIYERFGNLYIIKTDANLYEPCNLIGLSAPLVRDSTFISFNLMFSGTSSSPYISFTYPIVDPLSTSSSISCPLAYDTVEIILTSPDSGEINVPFNANVGVWFSGSIDINTLRNVEITGWDGSTFRNYDFNYTCPTNLFCVLDPIQTFRPSEIITVDFRGILDSLGNPIKPKVITFRTQEVDTTYPVIVYTVPDSGATGVPANTRIGVKFSKEMDTTTVNSSTVSITGSVSGSHGFTRSCPTLDYCILDPDIDFTPGEEVNVVFSSGIMGLNGKNLVPKTVVFSVGSADNTAPTIVIMENDLSPNDTIIVYDNREPIKAYVSDDIGIHAVEWVFRSESFIEYTNCNGESYGNPDTSCFRIPDAPAGIYLLRAYAKDMSWNQGYDSIFVDYRDTTKPYIVFTDPQDGQVGVSPTTDIRIIFSENMDTSRFGYLKVRIGSSEYPYTYIWEDRRSLKVNPTVMLPYDSTVKILVDSFVDLSGNMMMRDSFSFRIVSNAFVNVIITRVEPDTVYYGSGDSTYIEGVISSAYAITDAKVIVDGNLEYSMIPKDGAFDEVVETVYVRVDLSGLNVGEHNVIVRGWNAYGYGDSEARSVYVKMIGFLEERNVIVYPNPVKDKGRLKLILGGDAYGVIEIFDLKAKKVFSLAKNFEGFKTNIIELPKLPPGLYLLRVKANDRKVEKWFAVIR